MKKLVSLLLIVSMCMIVLTSSPVTGIRAPPSKGSCTITAPVNGAEVSGTVTIVVDATSTPEILIDGAVVATAYSYDWDTTGETDGDHIIKADLGRGVKDEITVTVNNGGTPPPPPPPPPGGDGVVNKWAVIWGVSDYKAISDLSFCDEDVDDWFSYLNSEYTIVAKLVDSQATEYAIKQAVAEVISLADADDQIVYTSSGHGGLSGRTSYLCAWDCNAGENGENGFILDTEFAEMWANTPCKTFIFLDHCHSGGMDEVMKTGIYMTTTCTVRGYGYDVPAYSNGAWTYWYLEAGLVGQGFTTAEDCFDWASANYPYGSKDAPQEFDMIDGYFTF
jgi:hypothetical protein